MEQEPVKKTKEGLGRVTYAYNLEIEIGRIRV
jgi:hypothetical protein